MLAVIIEWYLFRLCESVGHRQRSKQRSSPASSQDRIQHDDFSRSGFGTYPTRCQPAYPTIGCQQMIKILANEKTDQDAVRKLLSDGANPEAENKRGREALRAARMNGHSVAV